MGNTIEGGLMKIKTPYRIPCVSEMAALVLVTSISHLRSSSCASFSKFLWSIGRKRRSFATVTVRQKLISIDNTVEHSIGAMKTKTLGFIADGYIKLT